ncbi:protein of unknown function [Paenibacillus sp. cl6col]|uniref:DUF4259 domain-containing protein n=1 Tax=Paenibacillus alvei TaxID=44250 RepID=A0ABT4E7I8_PAEAL|nr:MULTISPECIES: DUF4259 domain-containing protein [Paenibacillus]MCY9529709.1 DUF4259 domain-containing protein [Paenibacillus alvei]SDG49273.1 protein of unknown function [Paenibacillus sp. cl6col]
MGAWGYGILENDTVLDWVEDLLETQDLSLITESIEMVLDDSEIESYTAEIALGAIEILAALQDRPGNEEYDEELENWINRHKGQGKELLVHSQKALGKILDESELRGLREGSEKFEEWVKIIKELEGRLMLG